MTRRHLWCLLATVPACLWVEVALGSEPTGQRYALVIGIAGYPNFAEPERLKYADRDAQLFYEFLQKPEAGGFSRSNIRLLTNENATAVKIRQEIVWLSKRVRSSDTLYVFFAGHGLVDEQGRAYFLPWEGVPENPGVHGFRADEFLRDLKDLTRFMFTFIDACHAGAAQVPGGFARSSSNVTAAVQLWATAYNEIDAADMTFMSATPTQRSWEDSQLQHGLFTYYLIQGLSGEADGRGGGGRDDTITTRELYRYVLDNVEERSSIRFTRQSPVISPTYKPDFPLARLGLRASAPVTASPAPKRSLKPVPQPVTSSMIRPPSGGSGSLAAGFLGLSFGRHRVFGRVGATDGSDLAGATVSLVGTYGPVDRSEVTDSTGRFAIERLPQGLYFLSVTAPGFAGITKDSVLLANPRAGAPALASEIEVRAMLRKESDPSFPSVMVNIVPSVIRNVIEVNVRAGDRAAAGVPAECPLAPFNSGEPEPATREVLTDKDGTFRCTVGGPGTYVVKVGLRSDNRWRGPVVVSPDRGAFVFVKAIE